MNSRLTVTTLAIFATFFLGCGDKQGLQKKGKSTDIHDSNAATIKNGSPESEVSKTPLGLSVASDEKPISSSRSFQTCGVKFRDGSWTAAPKWEPEGGTFQMTFLGAKEVRLQGVYTKSKILKKIVLSQKDKSGVKTIAATQLLGGMKGNSFLISLQLPKQHQFNIVNVMGIAHSDGRLTEVGAWCRK